MSGWTLVNRLFGNTNPGNQGLQTPTLPFYGIDGALESVASQRLRDVVGKLKISQSQNIYDADFEYGIQPLRWENFIQNSSGTASIIQQPGLGGVAMTISGTGDITVRQSRPYHRYQPGKTMYMASNVNFGVLLLVKHNVLVFLMTQMVFSFYKEIQQQQTHKVCILEFVQTLKVLQVVFQLIHLFHMKIGMVIRL
jgi:hypothetical protein